jgi:hypothetical protein
LKPFSRVFIASIFLLLVLTSLFPVAQSTSVPPSPGPGFEDVYVFIKDREHLETEDNNWYSLELEVIGNYGSEDDKTTLSNGEILLTGYDKSKDPDYHELDDGDVLQIDFNIRENKKKQIGPTMGPTIDPTLDNKDDESVIHINSIKKTTLPPSLCQYHTPPLLILVIITAVIVLVVMIILVFFFKRRLKKAKIAFEKDSNINYES